MDILNCVRQMLTDRYAVGRIVAKLKDQYGADDALFWIISNMESEHFGATYGTSSAPQYKFEEEWNPDETPIQWQKMGREKLNNVIRAYNQWQIHGFNQSEKRELLAFIECGIQTFGQRDGGEDWLATMERMKKFVEDKE